MHARKLGILLTLCSFLSFVAHADFRSANQALQQKNYASAFGQYEAVAQLGYAPAQQIVVSLYEKGLGVEANVPLAMVYYRLVLEQGANETIKNRLTKLNSQLNKSEKAAAETLWLEYQARIGARALNAAAMPQPLESAVLTRLPRRAKSNSPSVSSHAIVKRSPLSSVVLEFDIAPDGSVRDLEVAHNLFTDEKSQREMISFSGSYHYRVSKKAKTYYGARTTWSQSLTRQYLKSDHRKEYKKLLKLEKSAEQGNAYAQYVLATYIYAFPALEVNKVKYADYIKRSAHAFLPQAETEYAHLLFQGTNGVKRDPEMGLMFLFDAAQTGYTRAQYKLARQFLSGYFIEKDEQKAAFWLEKAAQAGDLNAKYWLGRLYVSAQNKQLHNPERAQSLLADAKKIYREDPNWFYYQNRLYQLLHDKDEAEDYLDDAIDLANHYKWKVQSWKNEYKKLKAKETI